MSGVRHLCFHDAVDGINVKVRATEDDYLFLTELVVAVTGIALLSNQFLILFVFEIEKF